jgi:hypothetical protein
VLPETLNHSQPSRRDFALAEEHGIKCSEKVTWETCTESSLT